VVRCAPPSRPSTSWPPPVGAELVARVGENLSDNCYIAKLVREPHRHPPGQPTERVVASWAGSGPVEFGHQVPVGLTGAFEVVVSAAKLGVKLVDHGLQACHLSPPRMRTPRAVVSLGILVPPLAQPALDLPSSRI
jgi:hypothetical protein